MRVVNNIQAVNAHRVLGTSQNDLAKTTEKLSSGFRINRAGDDAAGLAISEKMRGQVRGLRQASRNAQDGISLIQTAEGASQEVHAMLQRARELAVQTASDTMTDDDRNKVQVEVDALVSQIDTIASNTEFNTIKLLNSNNNVMSDFEGIPQATIDELTAKLPGWINDSLDAISNQLDLALPDSPVKRTMNVVYYYDSGTTTGASMGTSDGGATLTLSVNLFGVTETDGSLRQEGVIDTLLAHEVVHALQFTEMAFVTDGASGSSETWFIEGLATAIQGGNVFLPGDGNIASGAFSGDYATAYQGVKVLHEITNGGINAIIDQLELGVNLDDAIANTVQSDAGTELAGAAGIGDFSGVADFLSWFNTNAGAGVLNTYLTSSTDFSIGTGAITTGSVKGSSSNLTLGATIPNGTGTALVDTHFDLSFENTNQRSSTDIVFQLGANAGQKVRFNPVDLSVIALGVSTINVSTQDLASQTITKVDKAIESVATTRAYFGALQNRLEHTIKNLDNTEENLQASESRIRDADMAKTMIKQTKLSILAQAGQAMLSQANQTNQGVLQLLR